MGKRNSHFHFKQFSISHERSTMKVGTDGVLLGAWANVDYPIKKVLDIGTGSGLIALMLAQRTPADVVIDAVEIEEQDANQALENVLKSPWPSKVRVFTSSIQQFNAEHQYQLIIANPPFFINSFQPPDQRRLHTRHTTSLSFEDLIEAVVNHLSDDGVFNVILPDVEGLQFVGRAQKKGLYCIRKTGFRPRPHKPVERWLLAFSKVPGQLESDEIIMFQEAEIWSERYKELTREFYLKF